MGSEESVDEFSFKATRTWGQATISPGCVCVWCKSRQLGGRGSPRLTRLMTGSFSADLLLATESYWTKSHLDFCQTLTAEPLCKSMWSAFR